MKHINGLQNIKILLSIFILTSLWSCERDDICASETSTTPHVIIRFYNINKRTELKKVNHMTVSEEGNTKEMFTDQTIESIVLPLRIDALDILNTSRFVIRKDINLDTDEDANTNSNPDIIELTYTPELIYVSRACGYKSIFNDLTSSLDPDTNNWIKEIEVINTTINNEDAAHINIYH